MHEKPNIYQIKELVLQFDNDQDILSQLVPRLEGFLLIYNPMTPSSLAVSVMMCRSEGEPRLLRRQAVVRRQLSQRNKQLLARDVTL